MKRKTTVWILQATNYGYWAQDDLDIVKIGKLKERN